MRNYIALALIAATTSAVNLTWGDAVQQEAAPEKQGWPEAEAAEEESSDSGCKGFDDLRADHKAFWKNFINEGYLGVMDKEEGWVDPCAWELSEFKSMWDIPWDEIPKEDRKWARNNMTKREVYIMKDICDKPKGSDDRVIGMMKFNQFTEEEMEAAIEKGNGEVKALYEQFSGPMIDKFQDEVECAAVKEFEKIFEKITSGVPLAQAGGAEGEDAIGEMEQTAEAVNQAGLQG